MKNAPLFLLLAFIGGFTDASSFINFEVFTGHLTGNSILSAIYLVQHNMPVFSLSIVSLISFLIGSISGAIIRIKLKQRFLNSLTLFLITLLLLITVIVNLHAEIYIYKLIAISLISIAMGIQNGFFNQSMGVGSHTTYITGMTTSLISALITKTKDPTKAHNSKIILPLLIITFILGAFAGALIATNIGLTSYMVILGLYGFALIICFLQDLSPKALP